MNYYIAIMVWPAMASHQRMLHGLRKQIADIKNGIQMKFLISGVSIFSIIY